MKFLRCKEDRELMQEMRRHFGMVKVIKPEASRQESAEAYFLAQNYKRLPATVYQLSPNTRA